MEDEKKSGLDNPELSPFAPADLTDGRDLLEWKSKYPSSARKQIWFESAYLGFWLCIVPVAMFVLFAEYPSSWLGLDPVKYKKFSICGMAWFGGILGGTLFAMKWHYHVVAKQRWHEDRRLWRLFTPHISGGLAFVVITLMSSGVFKVFDKSALESSSLVVSLAFLVGYFSDSAIGKLNEIAQTIFGVSRNKDIHKSDPIGIDSKVSSKSNSTSRS